MIWTEERVSELKRLWAAGHSAGQCAKVLDPTGAMTRNSVIGKVCRLGLDSRKTKYSTPWKLRSPQPSIAIKGRRVKLWGMSNQRGRNTNPTGYCGKREVPVFRPEALKPREVVLREPGPQPKGWVRFETCQHIAGEASKDDGCKCGKPTANGNTYCAEHHSLCWDKKPVRRNAQYFRRAA